MKELHDAMCDVLVAAHIVNSVGPATVFCDYSGHIQAIWVRVHREGWSREEPRRSWDWNRSIYLDRDDAIEQLRDLRRDILAELTGVNVVPSTRDDVVGASSTLELEE